MDLRDSLNQFYYGLTVCELRQVSKTGGGSLSYNSIMYLDIISYQQESGGSTITTLADTLHITKAAATIKVGELVKLGLVAKTRSQTDRRVSYLTLTGPAAKALRAYDRPFERVVKQVESAFSQADIDLFCTILSTFSQEYQKEFSFV